MKDLDELQARLGYNFKGLGLLEMALTHRSAVAPAGRENNERLEFLGDAVLSLAVSDLLMKRFCQIDEGELSRRRASLVNSHRLAQKASEVELGTWLRVGKGEEKSGGRGKESILAAAYEALIGAIYLDRGYGAARRFVLKHFGREVKDRSPEVGKDHKTKLQELTQKLFKTTPTYTVVDTSGPDHAKRFSSEISVEGRRLGAGSGRSKKSAEQNAAMKALAALKKRELEERGREGSGATEEKAPG